MVSLTNQTWEFTLSKCFFLQDMGDLNNKWWGDLLGKYGDMMARCHEQRRITTEVVIEPAINWCKKPKKTPFRSRRHEVWSPNLCFMKFAAKKLHYLAG